MFSYAHTLPDLQQCYYTASTVSQHTLSKQRSNHDSAGEQCALSSQLDSQGHNSTAC